MKCWAVHWNAGVGAAIAVGITSLVSVTACTATSPTPPAVTQSIETAAAPSTSAIATPTPAPSPTPTPTPTPNLLSPLDGLPIDETKPVLIVKLDNTTNAQPHAGLDKADLVYLEEVEYGITRIAAVFSSAIPKRIGPVRSARITDIELLQQYGAPAFAYSGAQHKLFPALDSAPFHDVSPRRGAQGYTRDFSRSAPYNLYLDGHVAIARAPKAEAAHDMGFVFDSTIPDGGLTAAKAHLKWSYASADFKYDETSGLYKVWLNEQRARTENSAVGQRAATVVIQYVKQRDSIYHDKYGGITPEADTVGTGDAVVMRDGLAWDVTWNRPNATAGTTFTMADGSPMPFKPGQAWIVLLNKKRPATITPLTEPTPSTTTASATTTVSAASSPRASS